MRTPFRLPHLGRRVAGVGPIRAPVLWLGEAPGKDEEEVGEPFVGAAGQFAWAGRDWSGQAWEGLDAMGLPRSECRIENVIEVRPPENSLLHLAPGNVAKWQAEWWTRLETLEPTVIVPVGNLALNTLRRAPLPIKKNGKWRTRSTPQGPQIDWRDKITNWRGSIFSIRTNNGRKVKVIPAYHPAYVLRNGDAFDVWKSDLAHILEDRHFPQVRRDPRVEVLLDPTTQDCLAFHRELGEAHARKGHLTVDIETGKGPGRKKIRCVGFGLSAQFALVLDDRHWPWIAKYLRHPIGKSYHYGLFDTYVLALAGGIHSVANRWDSHQLHHCLDPRDDHHLAYCASRDLRVKFWKHEGKEEGKTSGVKDPTKLRKYCGKDVGYTHALVDRYVEQVKEAGLLDYYRWHYRRLSAACLHLSLTGFRVDDDARKEMASREQARLTTLASELETISGLKLIAKGGGLSAPNVTKYFYDILKCKPFYRRGTSNRTADELAIRRLTRKYKKARVGGETILAYRHHKKIAESLTGKLVDEDGRMRSLYTPTTKTGRLRSTKNAMGTGVNGQNRDRHSDLRRMFVADHDQLLVEVDESQAEDRIVNGMSGDKDLLELARMPPTEVDQHALNASLIFECSYEEAQADKEKRDLGKRTRHAANYGMEGVRMSEVVLLETEGRLVLDPDDCDEWLGRLHTRRPGLGRYHEWVSQSLVSKRCLENSWGGKIHFKGLRLSKEDHKEGFAYLPQSEVGKLMNILGFVKADRAIQAGWWPGARIVQQGHDSLVISTPPEFAWKIVNFLCENISVERTYPGAGGPWTLRMPVGVKVGPVWKGMVEWKSKPKRDEFESVVASMMASPSSSLPSDKISASSSGG